MAKRKASAGTATTTARSKKAAKTSNTNNNRDSEPDRLVVDHRHESSSPNPQVPVDNIHYDNGPYPRQEYNHHNLHSLDIDPRLDIMNHHFHMGNDGTGSGGSMDAAMMGNTDEGDNRSRNAKAQRRHREKRKAHLKALEDSVQLLTAQLEDARRQLGQAAYITGNRPGGPAGSAPLSPQQTKDNNQAQAENAYLRDENADLRRQLYAYRVSYPPPPPSVGKDGNGDWNEVKPEAFMYAPGGSPGRRSGGPRGSNEVGPVNSGESGTSTADGSSGPNSANASNQNSNGYPVDHFANMHQRSRSRVPSASSAPSASPYMPSDPRSMDARYAPPPNVRYEPQSGMYNAPPPHAVARYDPSAGPDGHQQHSGHYGRPDGHNGVSWPPEQNGPPPFTAYGMGFPHDSQGQQQQSEDWRQEH